MRFRVDVREREGKKGTERVEGRRRVVSSLGRRKGVDGTEITTYTIRAPNCWQRVTGDYFLIAAIKRTRSPRIAACIGRV